MVVGARVNLEELREIGFDEDRDNLAKNDKGNFLLTGDEYQEAVKHTWKKVFGTIHASPGNENTDLLEQYANQRKWNWSLALNHLLICLKNT